MKALYEIDAPFLFPDAPYVAYAFGNADLEIDYQDICAVRMLEGQLYYAHRPHRQSADADGVKSYLSNLIA